MKRQLLALFFAFVMVMNLLPAGAQSGTVRITAFLELEEEVRNREVEPGTEVDNLGLPTSLEAVGYPVSEETDALKAGENEISTPQSSPVTVFPVSWKAAPEYAGQLGTYTFTPELNDGFTIADGVLLPEITVTVVGEEPVRSESPSPAPQPSPSDAGGFTTYNPGTGLVRETTEPLGTVNTIGNLSITKQPENRDITDGAVAVFSVEAVGASSYQWYGSKPLYDASLDSVGSEDGTWDLQDGNVWQSKIQGIDGGRAVLTAVFDVPEGGSVGFDWKVSSEQSYDLLSYSLTSASDVEVASDKISGINMQDFDTIAVSGLQEGQYTLTITYKKDSSGNRGEDCGWIRLHKIVPLEGKTENSLTVLPETEGYFEGAQYYCVVGDGQDSIQSETAYLGRRYEVTIDPTNGNPPSKVSCLTYESVAEPEEPTWEGHRFIGWYTDPIGVNLYDFAGKVTSSFTIYAFWTKDPEGLGTAESPYLLRTWEDLYSAGRNINEGVAGFSSAVYRMEEDITLPSGRVWSPVESFSGTFDGNGKTIDGLVIDLPVKDDSRAALFLNIGTGGTVKNVTIGANSSIRATYAAGIALVNLGSIEGCTNRASVTGDKDAAGIVMTNESTGTVSDSSNEGTIASQNISGGIVSQNAGRIKDCTNLGFVKAVKQVKGEGATAGGIAGLNSATIENCANHGEIMALYLDEIAVNMGGTITGCESNGTLTALSPVGYTMAENGVMAYANDGYGTIDALALYQGKWIKTTYGYNGYKAHYERSDFSVEVNSTFVNHGKFVRLDYTVTAERDVTDGAFGVTADIQIGQNDRAPLSILTDSQGNPMGLRMRDDKSGNESYNAQLNLFFANTYGVSDADTFWLGYYNKKDANANVALGDYLKKLTWVEGEQTGTYTTNDTANADTNDRGYVWNEAEGLQLTGIDSGMAVGWDGIAMGKGQKRTFSLLVGVGSSVGEPPVSKTLDFDLESGTAKFSVVDKDAHEEEGVVTNPLSIFYSLDGATEQEGVEPLIVAGEEENEYTYTFSLPKLSEGFHTLNVWAMNDAGMLSSVLRVGIPVWSVPVYEVTGEVQTFDGLPFEGVTVSLKRGTELFAEAVSGADGHFVFAQVPTGIYNLVITTAAGATITKQFALDAHNTDAGTFRMPETQKNSSVEVTGSGTPPVVADGLNEQFNEDAITDDPKGGVTQKDLDTAAGGGSVNLILEIAHREEVQADGAGLILKQKDLNEEIGMYLDISVRKIVKNYLGNPVSDQSGTLSSLPKLLDIRLALPQELQGKKAYQIYRVHDGAAEVLKTVPDPLTGEYFEWNGSDVILHVNRFSTYAIAYTVEYPMYVNNVGIDPSQDKTVQCGTGTAVYTAANQTLTLNSAIIDRVYPEQGAGIWGENLKIVLKGNNVIGTREDSPVSFGILSTGTLDVSGDGTLDIYAKQRGSLGVGGILSQGTMNLSGGQLTLTNQSPECLGTYAISSSASIMASHAKITIAGFESGFHTVDGGVSIAGEKSDVTVRDASWGITCGTGKVFLSGGKLDIAVSGDGAVGITCGDDATITDAQVSVTSGSSNGIKTDGTLTVSGDSNVTAKGAYVALFGARGVTISGGIVEAESTGDVAVFSQGLIDLSGGMLHARGGANCAAVAARSVKTAQMNPEAKITLGNLVEKNGAKIMVSAWFEQPLDSGTETRSWTSFVPKNAQVLTVDEDGVMTNAVNEVWLAAPYTMTYDINGGNGENYTAKVYPQNCAEEPQLSPTRSNYRFTGWYTTKQADIPFEFDRTPVGQDTTVYAGWEPKTTVTITDEIQRVTYSGGMKAFEIRGTSLDADSFEIVYNQGAGNVSPKNVGTYNVVISRSEDENYASFSKTITGGLVIENASQPAPTPGKTDETVRGRNDGTLTGVNDTMEYRLSTATVYTPVASGQTTVTGLAPGTYLVRYRAKTNFNAGADQTVIILQGAQNTYTLAVVPPTFTAIQYGDPRPAAQPITITSKGNTAAAITKVALTAGDINAFELGGQGGTVAAGESIQTWTVQPKAGLSAKPVYSATVTVTYTGGETVTANVSISVTKRQIAVSATAQEKVVGSPEPEFTFQVESGSILEGETAFRLTRLPGETAGQYPIVISEQNPNYLVSYMGNYFTVKGDGSETVEPVTGTMSGTIAGADENTTATLLYQGQKLAESHGNGFRFAPVADGVYNIVITKDGKTKTVFVEIQDGVQLPETLESDVTTLSQSTLVEIVGSDTPNVAGDGLEAVLAPTDTSLKVVVEKVEVSDLIKRAAGKNNVLFNLDITAYQNDIPVSELNQVIRLAIPVQDANSEVVVYRLHDGVASSMPTQANVDGEYVEIRFGYLLLHVKKFSEYAVAVKRTGGTGGNGIVAGPSASVSGTVLRQTVLKLDSAQKNSTIYYTLDGSKPTKDSLKYEKPLILTEDTTVNFLEIGSRTSSVVTKEIKVRLNSVSFVENAEKTRYINPISATQFGPDEEITRYDMVKSLYRLLEFETGILDTELSDVKEEMRQQVAYFQSAGIIEGFEDGTFRGNQGLTRAEFVKVLAIILKLDVQEGKADYTDTSGHWAEGYIAAFTDLGYVKGYDDGSFGPDQKITRAEFTAMVNRIVKTDTHSVPPLFSDLPSGHWAYADVMSSYLREQEQ